MKTQTPPMNQPQPLVTRMLAPSAQSVSQETGAPEMPNPRQPLTKLEVEVTP